MYRKLVIVLFLSVCSYGVSKPKQDESCGIKELTTQFLQNGISSIWQVNLYYGGVGYTGRTANINGKKYRYVYSKQMGWLDMRHVSSMAYLSYLMGPKKALQFGEWIEKYQCKIFVEHDDSGVGPYSYEDLPSNLLGTYLGYYWFKKHFLYAPLTFTDLLLDFFDQLEVVENPWALAHATHTNKHQQWNTSYRPHQAFISNDSMSPLMEKIYQLLDDFNISEKINLDGYCSIWHQIQLEKN